MNKLLMGYGRIIRKCKKIRLVKILVFLRAICSVENGLLKKSDVENINSFEMRC